MNEKCSTQCLKYNKALKVNEWKMNPYIYNEYLDTLPTKKE